MENISIKTPKGFSSKKENFLRTAYAVRNSGIITLISSKLENKKNKIRTVFNNFTIQLKKSFYNIFKFRRIFFSMLKALFKAGLSFRKNFKNLFKVLYIAIALSSASCPAGNTYASLPDSSIADIEISQIDERRTSPPKVSFLASNSSEIQFKRISEMQAGQKMDLNQAKELRSKVEQFSPSLLEEFSKLRKLQARNRIPGVWSMDDLVMLNDLEAKHANSPEYEMFKKSKKTKTVGGSINRTNNFTDGLIYLNVEPKFKMKIEESLKKAEMKRLDRFLESFASQSIEKMVENPESISNFKKFSSFEAGQTKKKKINKIKQEQRTIYQKVLRFLNKGKEKVKNYYLQNKIRIHLVIRSTIIITGLILLYRVFTDTFRWIFSEILSFIEKTIYKYLLRPRFKVWDEEASDEENETFQNLLNTLSALEIFFKNFPSFEENTFYVATTKILQLMKKHPERAEKILQRLILMLEYFEKRPQFLIKIFKRIFHYK